MTFDDFLVLVGVALILIIVGMLVFGAFRLGVSTGRTVERLRWHQEEMRIEREMIAETMKQQDEWEEELDV